MVSGAVWSRSTWIVVWCDVELRLQHLLEPVQQGVLVDAGRRDHVHRDGVEAARDRPRVDVVHLAHALHGAQRAADRLRVEVRGARSSRIRTGSAIRPRAETMHSTETPSAITGSAASQPNAATSTPATTTPTEPATSAIGVQQRAVQVEVVAARAGAPASPTTAAPLTAMPARPNRITPGARTSGGSPSRPIASIGDQDAEAEQRQAVDERRQDLDASPAERAPAGRAAHRQARGHQRDADGDAVGDVVRGVGQQRDGVEPERRRAPARGRTGSSGSASAAASCGSRSGRGGRGRGLPVSPPARAADRARRGRRRAPRGLGSRVPTTRCSAVPGARKARASGCAALRDAQPNSSTAMPIAASEAPARAAAWCSRRAREASTLPDHATAPTSGVTRCEPQRSCSFASSTRRRRPTRRRRSSCARRRGSGPASRSAASRAPAAPPAPRRAPRRRPATRRAGFAPLVSAIVETDSAITRRVLERQLRLGQRPLHLRQDRHHLGQPQDAARDRHARGEAGAHGLAPGGDADVAVGCPDGGRPVRGAVDEQAVAEGHAPESEGLICHALTVARSCDYPVMADLFDNAAADALQAAAPLADRVRPPGWTGSSARRT